MASVSNVKHSDAEGVLLVGFHGAKRFSGFSSRPLPVIVGGLPRECFRPPLVDKPLKISW